MRKERLKRMSLRWCRRVAAALCAAWLWSQSSTAGRPCAFGVAGQDYLRAKLKRRGWTLHRSSNVTGHPELSASGRVLFKKIIAAQKWQDVQRVLQNYGGNEIQIFNAAMNQAVKFRREKLGAEVYARLCNLQVDKQAATYATALTIFSRLGAASTVRQVWEEAINTCDLDGVLAAARIKAAAMEGDVITAAQVLDDMSSTGVDIDIGHVTSAIRACWMADGKNHNVAKHLFYHVLPGLDLQANCFTFTCLVGALTTAPLQDLLEAYRDMKEKEVAPDEVFAETFLVTLLRKAKREKWTSPEVVAKRLRAGEAGRLAAARSALADFRAARVDLSTLSQHIEGALELLDKKLVRDTRPRVGRRGCMFACLGFNSLLFGSIHVNYAINKHTWRLLCSSFLGMTPFLLEVIAIKELHRSLQVHLMNS